MNFDHEDDDTTYYTLKKREIVLDRPRSWGLRSDEKEEYAPGKFRDVILWLPKSQCECTPNEEDPNFHDFSIPEWLVDEKNLENEVE